LSGISTHVLDTAAGKPAAGIVVHLESFEEQGGWRLLASLKTDEDGRCKQLLPPAAPLKAGQYRLRFETEPYYKAHSINGLYPVVEITFWARDTDVHMHVPLLLTANGYTTYRGT
jgi:5-hydroxyisourate hydrolase